MKFLNFSLLLFLALTGCASKLEQAGQEHALVFKKWQALSNYAGDSFSQEPIFMVASLVVEESANGREFVLRDFHLTDEESAFQINLRTPRFEDKYICNKGCINLTEYFNSDAQNATILTRYFDKYEFGLFEFYGDVFSLKKPMLAMKNVSKEHFHDYLNWLVLKGKHFNKLDEFTQYMRQSFSVEAYIQFIQNPNALYSQMLARGAEEGNLNFEPLAEMANWYADSDFIAEETAQFDQDDESPPAEMVDWNILQNANSNTASTLAARDNLIFNFKRSVQAEAGDLVCDLQTNSFGQAVDVRGSELTVSMIGQLQLVIDGVVSQSVIADSFTSQYPKQYAKLEGVQYYTADEIVVCEFKL